MDERTPREQSAPFIANVAADAVERHERRYHGTHDPPPGYVYGCEDCAYRTADGAAALAHCDAEKHSLALTPVE